MALIVPAILEESLDQFQQKLGTILRLPDLKRVQIDISDGIFTPHKTIQLSNLSVLTPVIEWEAHLMVQNPKDYFFDVKLAGFSTVIFHFEAIEDKSSLTALVAELRDLKLKVGLGINPETEAEQVEKYLFLFDQILVLGVHPGLQGQTLEQEVFHKIEKLKKGLKTGIIEVDGGVKLSNIKQLSSFGAEMFVIGSALFDRGDQNLTPYQNFEQFSNVLSAN
ncbi:MAG: ribulose-phosphate 3-epimerase [Candidatus Doudnabacteria bacterium]